jgi:hypothetical protein
MVIVGMTTLEQVQEIMTIDTFLAILNLVPQGLKMTILK